MKTRRFSTSVLTVATLLGLLASPAFATVTPFTASSNPVAPGKTITFNASIDAGVTANGAKVILRFYNSSGAHIGLASDTGVNFTAGTPTSVTISYTTASGLALGTYTYNLSFYDSSGLALSGAPNQTNDGDITVSNTVPPYVITPTPNPAPPGQTITFNSSLNPGVAATGAKVTFWFYNSGSSYVGSASATGLTFTAGAATPVNITYLTASSLAAGTYTYNLSYYNSSGLALAGAADAVNAGSFAIAAAAASGGSSDRFWRVTGLSTVI